jgi:enamine deaminase RidA (YjgF/YER057c/UK114 family)
MAASNLVPGRRVEKHAEPGIQAIAFSGPSHQEWHLSATLPEGQSRKDLFGRVASWLRRTGVRIVSQEVFGLPYRAGAGLQEITAAFGEITWPVTWVENRDETAAPLCGMQVWGVSGLPVEPVMLEGAVLGSLFEDEGARYCRLGGLAPGETTRSPEDQTRAVFEQMDAALSAVGMSFENVVRTWFFNRDILAWYSGFNAVRDRFFQEKQVFDGLMPASTGVGGCVPLGAALVAGLLAVKGKRQAVRAVGAPSPLQCPAKDYGSSFSRAVEVVTPGTRRLFISGTASIAPEGRTVHAGDAGAQVALTLDVVRAILESRGMGWNDVTRTVAYFKHVPDAPVFARLCAARGMPVLPAVVMNEDICREDLLFEIELDAIRPY